MDTRDWVVIGLMGAIQLAATVFVFAHPDVVNFATFATLTGTLITAYHWVIVKDQKEKDAC